jgi:hypothetical protein
MGQSSHIVSGVPVPYQATTKISTQITGSLAGLGADAANINPRAQGVFMIEKVLLSVKTAPVGAAIIIDVNIGGSTIFAAGDRPQIAAGATVSTLGAPILVANALINPDSVITVDVDQTGGLGTEGSDLAIDIVGHVLRLGE